MVVPQSSGCSHHPVIEPANLVPELVSGGPVTLHPANSVLINNTEGSYDAVLFSLGFGERFVLPSPFSYERQAARWTLLLQSLESRICPDADLLWYVLTKQFPIGKPFVMASAWLGRRYQKDAFMLISYDNTLPRVGLLFAGVGTLVGLAPFRALNWSFSTVDEDIFHLRKLLK